MCHKFTMLYLPFLPRSFFHRINRNHGRCEHSIVSSCRNSICTHIQIKSGNIHIPAHHLRYKIKIHYAILYCPGAEGIKLLHYNKFAEYLCASDSTTASSCSNCLYWTRLFDSLIILFTPHGHGTSAGLLVGRPEITHSEQRLDCWRIGATFSQIHICLRADRNRCHIFNSQIMVPANPWGNKGQSLRQ